MARSHYTVSMSMLNMVSHKQQNSHVQERRYKCNNLERDDFTSPHNKSSSVSLVCILLLLIIIMVIIVCIVIVMMFNVSIVIPIIVIFLSVLRNTKQSASGSRVIVQLNRINKDETTTKHHLLNCSPMGPSSSTVSPLIDAQESIYFRDILHPASIQSIRNFCNYDKCFYLIKQHLYTSRNICLYTCILTRRLSKAGEFRFASLSCPACIQGRRLFKDIWYYTSFTKTTFSIKTLSGRK